MPSAVATTMITIATARFIEATQVREYEQASVPQIGTYPRPNLSADITAANGSGP